MRWCGMGSLVIGAWVYTGCSGSPSDDDTGTTPSGACASGDISLDIGSGDEIYAPLADGDPVTIVHGPQGGWHVETAGLVKRSEKDISILPVITLPDLDLQITTNSQPEFKALVGYDAASCEGTFTGTRAFIDAKAGPGTDQQNICALAGRTMSLSITVSDIVSGRSHTSTVSVVAALDPLDVPECP